MTSQVQQNQKVNFKNDKQITPISTNTSPENINTDLMLRLGGLLQTSLDLKKLLSIFFHEINSLVVVDSMQFCHNETDVRILLGKKAGHACNYELSVEKEAIGEMTFSRNTRFREGELAALEYLMGALIYPLRNALAYHLAVETSYRDPLTGAGNRNALDRHLNREVELARRHNQSLSILMVDIDHFKNVNDGYGHASGDRVLKAVAESIANSIRKTDMLFRYGGEEFLVVLSNADITDSQLIGERIRQAIEDMDITTGGAVNLNVTVSIGAATLNNADKSTGELVDRADKALYLAKSAGRNRIRTSQAFTNNDQPGAKTLQASGIK